MTEDEKQDKLCKIKNVILDYEENRINISTCLAGIQMLIKNDQIDINSDDYDLDLPPSIGTRKCYECTVEPPGESRFDEVFMLIDGKECSVPMCPVCSDQHFNKPNYICKKCGYARAFFFVEGVHSDKVIKATAVCPDCSSQMVPIK